jgi:hypothetical protein
MKDLKQFIKTTLREFLNENKNISQRIDKALDWMNKYDIKISNKSFQNYVDYTNKNLYKIESLLNKINNKGYIWTSDLPMFFTTTLDDLEDSNLNLGDVKIYKQPVKIEYKYTHVANNPYEKVTDRYKITYINENTRDITDEITSDELIQLLEEGSIMTEYGVIGLSYDDVKKYIENL